MRSIVVRRWMLILSLALAVVPFWGRVGVPCHPARPHSFYAIGSVRPGLDSIMESKFRHFPPRCQNILLPQIHAL